jgi:hypothetical protein
MYADIGTMQQTSNALGQFSGELEADRLDRGITSRCEQGRAHQQVGDAVTFFILAGDATYQELTATFAALSDKVATTAGNISAADQAAADNFLSLLSFTGVGNGPPSVTGI